MAHKLFISISRMQHVRITKLQNDQPSFRDAHYFISPPKKIVVENGDAEVRLSTILGTYLSSLSISSNELKHILLAAGKGQLYGSQESVHQGHPGERNNLGLASGTNGGFIRSIFMPWTTFTFYQTFQIRSQSVNFAFEFKVAVFTQVMNPL